MRIWCALDLSGFMWTHTNRIECAMIRFTVSMWTCLYCSRLEEYERKKHTTCLHQDLRRFHMGTLMRIECASNPDRLRSHECALTWCASNAHRMQIRSNPPPEVVWMRIQTGSYYYSWFTRGYAYHEIVGSVGFTRWLGLWRVFMAPFRSALAATLGKK